MATLFNAEPLTVDQLNEVLRVVNESSRDERHNYRIMLEGERSHTARKARELVTGTHSDPYELAALKAKVQAWDRALELLTVCWPVLELPCSMQK